MEANNAIIITRNDVSLELIDFKFVKGDKKDQVYPAAPCTAENWELFTKWYGFSNILNVVQNYVKRQFQTIVADSIDPNTGKINMELFTKYATDLSVAGLRMKEINENLDELQAEVTKLIDEGNLGDPEVQAKLTELNGQVRAYRQMREDKSRKKSAEVEAEPSIAA